MYTCRIIWMHSPQSPKISKTQHERSFSLSARSPARSVALNYIASPQESVHSKPHLPLSWGAQEVALALSMPWWQIQHEQGHPQHLKKKVTITTCCMLSVYCAICYLLATHFWWWQSQKVWLSLRMLPGSVGRKCQLLPPSVLLELGGCDLAHLAGSHSWQCETTLP